jgi:small subunit ribosomal protein S1
MSWGRINHPSEMFEVGDEVEVMVLKFDPDSERVSLGLKQITEDPWAQVMTKYRIGDRVNGKVVSLTEYGAFVELEDGIEGLIHVSEMSWTKRPKHPSQIVAIGDIVESVILDIDTENKRISLGMKQIEMNPWELLQERYPVGSVVRGKIRNITNFGLFIGIEEGIDGLIHVSDISWSNKVKNPADHYEKTDEVEAVVLNIDVEKERFSLGIKQLTPDPWDNVESRYPLGSVVEGLVTKVLDFGAIVEIDDAIEGLVHISELSYDKVNLVSDVANEATSSAPRSSASSPRSARSACRSSACPRKRPPRSTRTTSSSSAPSRPPRSVSCSPASSPASARRTPPTRTRGCIPGSGARSRAAPVRSSGRPSGREYSAQAARLNDRRMH